MATLDAEDLLAIQGLIETAVSNLALEATLTEIKGEGWSELPLEKQTLVKIYSQVAYNSNIIDENLSIILGDGRTDESLVSIQAGVDSILSTIGSGSVAGPGATPRTITITAGGNPVVGVGVWITTDQAGTNVVGGTVYTNDAGEAVLLVDSGTTYYVWCDSDDAEISNPTEWEA